MNIIQIGKGFLVGFIFLASMMGIQGDALGQSQDPCDDPNSVRLYLPDSINVIPGENICIPIFVDNFIDVELFLFSVNISSTTLRYTNSNTVTSGLPSFTSSSVVYVEPEPDILRIFWIGPEGPDSPLETLPDGTVLLEVCFDVVGTPGIDGAIFINNAGLSAVVEVLSEDPVTGASINLPVCVDPTPPSVVVDPPNTPNPVVYITSVCGTSGGNDNGVAEISIFNGTPPYRVTDNVGNSLDVPMGQNVVVLSSLPIGTQTYTVSDATGMVSDPIDINITDISPFSISADIRPPRCPEGNNGRINLTLTGGRPFSGDRYFFDWGSELIGVDQDELTFVSNGSYPVTIRDSLGCSQDTIFEVLREPIEISIDNVNDAFCPGRENGQIEVSATGGGPYSDNRYIYSLSGITEDGTPYEDSRSQPAPSGAFVTIPAGRYVVTAIDSVGRGNCDLNPSDTIQITYSRLYEATITGGDISGCAAGTGRATIDLTTGSGTRYDYIITNNSGTEVDNGSATSEPFTSNCLPPGTYNISISDDQTCGLDTTFRLIDCDLLALAIGEDPSCFGESDGSISVNASSSNGSISYQWSTGDTTARIDDLPASDYSVTVSDTAGCQIVVAVTLFEPEPLAVDFDIDEIQCIGGTGTITAIPDGGEEPYIYTWDADPSGLAEDVLSGLEAGTYFVTVEDDDGCTVEDSITLTDPAAPMVTLTNITTPRCEGDPSGAATITVVANQGFVGPFSFVSNTGLTAAATTSFSPNNFDSGLNWVLYTDDATGCVFDTIFVDIPDAPPLTIDFDASTIGTVRCFGGIDTDGAIVNLSGVGSSGIMFTWPDGIVGNVRVGLGAGIYPVTLTSGTCMSVDTVVITQPDSLGIFVDQNASTIAACAGDDTDLVLDRTGGNQGPLSWEWRDASGTIVARDSFFDNVPSGVYTVIATDTSNCQGMLTVDVGSPEGIGIVLGELTQPLCFGDNGIIRVDSAFGGAGNYRFQVNTSPAQDISLPFEAPSGTYTIRVFDANGCAADTTVTLITPNEISVDLGPDIEIQLGSTGTLPLNVTATNPIANVALSPANQATCGNAECSELTITPINTQIFTAQVTDINGCTASDEVVVSVVRNERVYVPNVFNPQAADPDNRELRIYTGAGVEFIDYLRIFDRWGNLVHEELNLLPDAQGAGSWTGDFRGDALSNGVYVYVVQVRFLGAAEPSIRRGDITLIR